MQAVCSLDCQFYGRSVDFLAAPVKPQLSKIVVSCADTPFHSRPTHCNFRPKVVQLKGSDLSHHCRCSCHCCCHHCCRPCCHPGRRRTPTPPPLHPTPLHCRAASTLTSDLVFKDCVLFMGFMPHCRAALLSPEDLGVVPAVPTPSWSLTSALVWECVS